MKIVAAHPFLIYIIAAIACFCIMTIIDYLLGPIAEHLNAWVILNRIFGHDAGMGESIAIRKFGVWGAFGITILINSILGVLLILILKNILKIFH